jgi:hypothetical protein
MVVLDVAIVTWPHVNPTIPRIQMLIARNDFLVGVGGVKSAQLEGKFGRARSVRKTQLDKTNCVGS